MAKIKMTYEQAAKLRDEVARHEMFLMRLIERFKALKFDENHSVYRAARKAKDAMADLRQAAHDRSFFGIGIGLGQDEGPELNINHYLQETPPADNK